MATSFEVYDALQREIEYRCENRSSYFSYLPGTLENGTPFIRFKVKGENGDQYNFYVSVMQDKVSLYVFFGDIPPSKHADFARCICKANTYLYHGFFGISDSWRFAYLRFLSFKNIQFTGGRDLIYYFLDYSVQTVDYYFTCFFKGLFNGQWTASEAISSMYEISTSGEKDSFMDYAVKSHNTQAKFLLGELRKFCDARHISNSSQARTMDFRGFQEPVYLFEYDFPVKKSEIWQGGYIPVKLYIHARKNYATAEAVVAANLSSAKETEYAEIVCRINAEIKHLCLLEEDPDHGLCIKVRRSEWFLDVSYENDDFYGSLIGDCGYSALICAKPLNDYVAGRIGASRLLELLR